MPARDKTPPKFAVGSDVRVKKGVTAPNCPDMPMGGWCGKVYQVSGTIYFVHWTGATLEAIHSVRQRDGVDYRYTWLQEEVLEADSGGPLCIEQTNEGLRSVR